jgi:hypothetical protein
MLVEVNIKDDGGTLHLSPTVFQAPAATSPQLLSHLILWKTNGSAFVYFPALSLGPLISPPCPVFQLLVGLEVQQYSGTYISLYQHSSEIGSGGNIDGILQNADSPANEWRRIDGKKLFPAKIPSSRGAWIEFRRALELDLWIRKQASFGLNKHQPHIDLHYSAG